MKKLIGGAACFAGLAVLVTVAAALATPGAGVTSTTFAVGTFDELEAKTLSSKWQARIDTKGATDVHVLENRIAPGGTFGWHSHPGPSIVVVKAGALTLYRGDDPACTPRVVPAGSGFVDDGEAEDGFERPGPESALLRDAAEVPPVRKGRHATSRGAGRRCSGTITFQRRASSPPLARGSR